MNNSELNHRKSKILFILPDLQGGGAERTALNLLATINAEKYLCKIMVLRAEGIHLQAAKDSNWLVDSPLEPKLFQNQALEDPLRIIFSAWQIRRVVDKVRPDIVMTFMSDTSIPMYLSRARYISGARWIAREGNNTPKAIQDTINNKLLRRIAHAMVGVSLRSCDRLLCISKGMIRAFTEKYQVPDASIRVIYNPIDLKVLQQIKTLETAELSVLMNKSFVDQRPMILAVGRLSYQKGFDTLINAFANTLAKKSYQLTILGEGEQRQALEELVSRLQLTQCIYMPGYNEKPALWMKAAACFVLSSRWEGFGHVVVEAMAVGTPVISTRCEYGPSEILKNGEYGELIPTDDQKSLEEALMGVLENKTNRLARAEKAQLRAQDFSIETITREYEHLFSETLNLEVKQ